MDDSKQTKSIFASMLSQAYVALGREAPSKEVMRVFFDLLADRSIEDIAVALRNHMRDPDRGHMPPVPADIIRNIPGRSRFLGPNEAWAIGLKSTDEQASVCWTQEIAAAMGSAQPILDAGDEVGARMAFIESYRRLVAESEQAGREQSWSMSYGENQHMRIEAEQRAVAAGLLPPPSHDFARLEAPEAHRLIEPSDLRARMSQLAAELRIKLDRDDAKRAHDAEVARIDFEKRKQDAIRMLTENASNATSASAGDEKAQG